MISVLYIKWVFDISRVDERAGAACPSGYGNRHGEAGPNDPMFSRRIISWFNFKNRPCHRHGVRVYLLSASGRLWAFSSVG